MLKKNVTFCTNELTQFLLEFKVTKWHVQHLNLPFFRLINLINLLYIPILNVKGEKKTLGFQPGLGLTDYTVCICMNMTENPRASLYVLLYLLHLQQNASML